MQRLGQRFPGRLNVPVLLQLAAFAAQSGFALSPWVFSCLHSLTALQVCSALTNVTVFSISSFVNAVCFLAFVSLWNQFSAYTLLVVVLMPCSLSYMGCLIVHVHKKWTGKFQDVLQVVQLYSNLVFTFHTIIVGLYFLSAFFPAVLRSAIQTHRNQFRTLRTLNIVLISFCVSVPVLLGNEADEPEKPDAVHMAPAKILFRLVCVIAASVLSEAALGGDNTPQRLQNQVLPRNEIDDVPVPENNQDTALPVTGSHDPEIENIAPPVTGTKIENIAPAITGTEIENIAPPVTGTEVGNIAPPVTGTKTENIAPPVTGTEIENIAPPVTGTEIENIAPPVTGTEIGNITPPVTGTEIGNISLPVNSYDPEIESISFFLHGFHHILSHEEYLEC